MGLIENEEVGFYFYATPCYDRMCLFIFLITLKIENKELIEIRARGLLGC